MVGRGKSVQLILKCLQKQMMGKRETQLERAVIPYEKTISTSLAATESTRQPARPEQIIRTERQRVASVPSDQGSVADGQASVPTSMGLGGLGRAAPSPPGAQRPATSPQMGARMGRSTFRLCKRLSVPASAPGQLQRSRAGVTKPPEGSQACQREGTPPALRTPPVLGAPRRAKGEDGLVRIP